MLSIKLTFLESGGMLGDGEGSFCVWMLNVSTESLGRGCAL